MILFPLRFRRLSEERIIFADDAGRLFASDDRFLQRYAASTLSDRDLAFLTLHGFCSPTTEALPFVALARGIASRLRRPATTAYVLLVPTLRCNLHCSYCQVSRAGLSQTRFDWTSTTLNHVLRFLDALSTSSIKIEFQGGEPLLRLDLLSAVVEFCENRFESSSFVVCTNLSHLDDATWRLLDNPRVSISTSLDGDDLTHQLNRTKSASATREFLGNLNRVLNRYGVTKVSALPTVNFLDPPTPRSLIETYARFGFTSIYLRPVSFHGFARKAYAAIHSLVSRWNDYFERFVDGLVQWNSTASELMEEYYLTLALRRSLQAGHDGHLDFRNPAYLGLDSVVVDYDGTLYPTDEARMLARVGHADLSIGSVEDGFDEERSRLLNGNVFNNYDPDCIHCPHQPSCGTDVVDDLSRYGRADVPRPTTFFCQRQLKVFEVVCRLLLAKDKMVRRSTLHWLGLPEANIDLIPTHYD
jgi:His-Xaa-Ser system radical SAM maturase HxsB